MKQIVKLTFLLLVSVSLQAQNTANSPYSRFGLGELQSTFTPNYSAMGGVGTGIYNPLSVNVNNPASYSATFRQRFIMQTGGVHTTNMMQTADVNQTTNHTNISHFLTAFPVTKFWGASIGLLPYSEKAYFFTDDVLDPAAELQFSGSGGLSRFYIGNAIKPTKWLSLGANVNYLFGNLSTNRKVVFDDPAAFHARNIEETLIAGFYYDFGMLLHKRIKEWNVAVGATFNNGGAVNAERSVLTERFRFNSTLEVVEDTVFYSLNDTGNVVLPSATGFGMSFSNEQWMFAADYNTQNWGEFLSFGETDSLANSNRIAFGAEFTPDRKAIGNYFKMVRYRLGAYTANTYLQLNNQQLQEQVLSFGLGLPMKRSGALLNLSVELGQRGTVESGLIKDNFARFKVGLVLSDIWFIKRKYD